MILKPGAQIDGLGPEVRAALPIMEDARRDALEACCRAPMAVTSGAEGHAGDGVHGEHSLHYQGRAVDLRVLDFAHVWAAALTARLGPGWDVVLERDHLHVEYDSKGKT